MAFFVSLIYWMMRENLLLWNPTTEEFIFIPRSPVESLPYRKFIALIHGLGYDHIRDGYNVIQYVEFHSLSFYDVLFSGLP